MAFLDMRGRIERQIEQRTLMLSGISHDLRSPLTRLKLGLSLLPEDADTRKGAEACFRDGVCGEIAKAHRFDPKTEMVNKPSVDKGRKGAWDAASAVRRSGPRSRAS